MEDFNKVYPIATVTEVSHATKFQMPSTDPQSFLLTLTDGVQTDFSVWVIV